MKICVLWQNENKNNLILRLFIKDMRDLNISATVSKKRKI